MLLTVLGVLSSLCNVNILVFCSRRRDYEKSHNPRFNLRIGKADNTYHTEDLEEINSFLSTSTGG